MSDDNDFDEVSDSIFASIGNHPEAYSNAISQARSVAVLSYLSTFNWP
jgi:hypothetical protein